MGYEEWLNNIPSGIPFSSSTFVLLRRLFHLSCTVVSREHVHTEDVESATLALDVVRQDDLSDDNSTEVS